jgi:preprotein translocase SecE subunit
MDRAQDGSNRVSEAVTKGLLNWDASRTFLAEVQAEFKKIAWPTQNEIMGGTISVVVVVTIVAVALGIVDWVLSLIMSQVIP